MKTIKSTQYILGKIAKTGNLEHLAEDKAKAFEYNGEKYVYTSSVGDGTGVGYSAVFCHKAVLKDQYNGTIEPMNHADYTIAVLEGERERGYYARLINIDNELYVLTDHVKFEDNYDTGTN